MSNEIDDDHPIYETIVEMCKGNLGAARVLGKVPGTDIGMATVIMYVLNKHNILGSNIWIAYNDFCNQNDEEFMMRCLKQCEKMISYVKNSPDYVSYGEQNDEKKNV